MTNETLQVAIIMGSDSDLPVVEASFSILPKKMYFREIHDKYSIHMEHK